MNRRQSARDELLTLQEAIDREQEEQKKRKESKPKSARNSRKNKKSQTNRHNGEKQAHNRKEDNRTREEIAEDRKAKKLAKQKAKEARKKAAMNKKKKNPNASQQKGMENQRSQRRKNESTQKTSNEFAPDRANQFTRSSIIQFDNPKDYAKHLKKQMLARDAIDSHKQVPLFSHLVQYERGSSLSLQVGFSPDELHPAIIRVGLQYAEGKIQGTNARVVALMHAFKEWIQDFETPANKVFCLHLSHMARDVFRFLIDCRPQTITMGNVFRLLKMQMGKIQPGTPVRQAKEELIKEIDSFIQVRIEFADTIIADHGASKITNGDVVLVYAKSNVVELILQKAFNQGKEFRVIVADARPKLEGKHLLKRLVDYGIKCSYTLINAVSYVMQEVNKTFLGAHAVLGNGTVISRVGCALVGMLCAANNVPLMVCCETYKFDTKCKLNAICSNELGDPDELIPTYRDDSKFGDILCDWRDQNKLKILNIVYDLMPSEFVSMVITEFGMIPVTSVAAVLREHHEQMVDIGLPGS